MNYSTLFDLSKEPLILLKEVLLKRGFLVEFVDYNEQIHLILSDNSYVLNNPIDKQEKRNVITDAEYLIKLCKSINLCIDLRNIQYMEILWNGIIDSEFINNLFASFVVQREMQMPYHNKTSHFVNHVRGKKIPLSQLEPGIALLVKALSSIGIDTWSSCDGHGDKNASVCFTGELYSMWCEFVIADVSTNAACRNKWIFGSNILQIETGYESYPVEYYYEIFNVADCIYENRNKYLQLKIEISPCIHNKDEKDVIKQKMNKVFIEYNNSKQSDINEKYNALKGVCNDI
ncbi:MAG TPA: hypothetical protein PK419_02790 [Spirochaetota bacterium]|jgi:hypothetical protein|nr:hypothetical protein [Spirochaetota bacterium]HOH36821.1 hypothetical protein [Spirochaetota bacterium]HPY01900.1 hypothetical protein [Spirochaetota bacterium]HQA51761.1 hypothetical protein [Spirochaetota bacterium]